MRPPYFNTELTELPKFGTPQVFRATFLDLRRIYQNCCEVYADSSKSEDGVGAAAISEGIRKSASLPREATIFSADVHAIELAMRIVKETQSDKFVIFSDSLGVVRSIESRCRSNIIRRVLHEIHEQHMQGKTIQICWVSGHVGLPGNEEADRVAKAAAVRPKEYVTINYTDWNPVIWDKLNDKWRRRWQRTNSKLLEVREEPGKWKTVATSRKEQVVMNRLRAGHTRLTHQYLMDNAVHDIAPICQTCNNATTTVKHILLEYPGWAEQRRNNMKMLRRPIGVNLRKLLGTEEHDREVISYLKAINLFHKI